MENVSNATQHWTKIQKKMGANVTDDLGLHRLSLIQRRLRPNNSRRSLHYWTLLRPNLGLVLHEEATEETWLLPPQIDIEILVVVDCPRQEFASLRVHRAPVGRLRLRLVRT